MTADTGVGAGPAHSPARRASACTRASACAVADVGKGEGGARLGAASEGGGGISLRETLIAGAGGAEAAAGAALAGLSSTCEAPLLATDGALDDGGRAACGVVAAAGGLPAAGAAAAAGASLAVRASALEALPFAADGAPDDDGGDGYGDCEDVQNLGAWQQLAADVEEAGPGDVTPFGSSASSSSTSSLGALDADLHGEVDEDYSMLDGRCPFRTAEEVYGVLLLSSHLGNTEVQYDAFREFFNSNRPRHRSFPSIPTLRGRVIPAALRVGGLPLSALSTEHGSIQYVLPSAHIAR